MSAVESAWSARITKKHSASAMAPHGRGATPFHQCWWSTPICSSVVQGCDVVGNLGILFDSELSMKQHGNKVASVFIKK